MEASASIDSSKVCRTCLGTSGVLQSIFGSKSNIPSLHLSDLIQFCTSLEVILGDGLPDLICTQCVVTIVNMYNFKNQCINADKVLREQLESISNLKQDVEEITIKIDYSDNFEEEANQNEYSEEYVIRNIIEETKREINKDNFGDMATLTKLQMQPKVVHNVKHVNKINRNGFLKTHKIPQIKIKNINKQLKLKLKKKYTPRQAWSTELTTCEKCNITFEKKEDLWQHLMKDHKEIGCEICGLKFRTLFLKKKHMRVQHFKNKGFLCTTCEDMFTTQKELDKHMNVHTGVKSHYCEICFKGFDSKSDFKDHLKTHNGEKAYQCKICSQKFGYLGNLQRHLTRHSKVKNHICIVCCKEFASKDELTSHLRAHTSRKSFICSICSIGFTTKTGLSKHMLIHSKAKSHKLDSPKKKLSKEEKLRMLEETEPDEETYNGDLSESLEIASDQYVETEETVFVIQNEQNYS